MKKPIFMPLVLLLAGWGDCSPPVYEVDAVTLDSCPPAEGTAFHGCDNVVQLTGHGAFRLWDGASTIGTAPNEEAVQRKGVVIDVSGLVTAGDGGYARADFSTQVLDLWYWQGSPEFRPGSARRILARVPDGATQVAVEFPAAIRGSGKPVTVELSLNERQLVTGCRGGAQTNGQTVYRCVDGTCERAETAVAMAFYYTNDLLLNKENAAKNLWGVPALAEQCRDLPPRICGLGGGDGVATCYAGPSCGEDPHVVQASNGDVLAVTNGYVDALLTEDEVLAHDSALPAEWALDGFVHSGGECRGPGDVVSVFPTLPAKVDVWIPTKPYGPRSARFAIPADKAVLDIQRNQCTRERGWNAVVARATWNGRTTTKRVLLFDGSTYVTEIDVDVGSFRFSRDECLDEGALMGIPVEEWIWERKVPDGAPVVEAIANAYEPAGKTTCRDLSADYSLYACLWTVPEF